MGLRTGVIKGLNCGDQFFFLTYSHLFHLFFGICNFVQLFSS